MNDLMRWISNLPKKQKIVESKIALRNFAAIQAHCGKTPNPKILATLKIIADYPNW